MTNKKRFLNHKGHAKSRGTPFKFTYVEWVAWWEKQLGPNWSSKRGRKGYQYCMCRKGDKGPYSPENVICQTNRKNSHDTIANKTSVYGTRNGRCKLTEAQVREIRLANVPLAKRGIYGKGRPCTTESFSSLAKKFCVSRTMIIDIRNGANWKHI